MFSKHLFKSQAEIIREFASWDVWKSFGTRNWGSSKLWCARVKMFWLFSLQWLSYTGRDPRKPLNFIDFSARCCFLCNKGIWSMEGTKIENNSFLCSNKICFEIATKLINKFRLSHKQSLVFKRGMPQWHNCRNLKVGGRWTTKFAVPTMAWLDVLRH